MIESVLTREEIGWHVQQAADLLESLLDKGKTGAQAYRDAEKILNGVAQDRGVSPDLLIKEFKGELQKRRGDNKRIKRIQEDQYAIPDESKDIGIEPEKVL